jgi:molybdopterin-guanine dinucleotide biosynthesis protein A
MAPPAPELKTAGAVVGFAVAGGRSTRMGRDKAGLPWGPSDLLDHTITRLAAVTPDVRILSGPTVRYADRGRPVLPDVIADAGAMAGLLTALRALPDGGRALLLAVDLPLVTDSLLRGLLAALSPEVDAVVPLTAVGPEPLCAVYAVRCRAAVERAVVAGRFKMTAFWPDVRVGEIAADELRAFGDPARLFLNVNSPEDLRRAQAFASP